MPEKLVKTYIHASEGINDMPRGEIAFNDWKLTEEQMRQREIIFKQTGMTGWLVLAIDEKTGEGVGFTEVEFNRLDHARMRARLWPLSRTPRTLRRAS